MAKRFTATEKWDDPWFRGLTVPYKLLWYYVCDNCDNAGVWKVDLDVAGWKIGHKFDALETLKILNSDRGEGEFRVKEFCNNRYWFIHGFYSFQWGNMKSNSVLRGVHNSLMKHKFYKEIVQFIPSLEGGSTEGQPSIDPPKEKVKVKVKVEGGMGETFPPSVEDVRLYCSERKNSVDAQKWHDFYVSKGWMIGKNKMVNWKAAVRHWEQSTEPKKDTRRYL